MENWRQNYAELKDYITKHPSIEISTSVMVILDDVRPEFYRLFDRVRAAYVKEMVPSLLAEASLLSSNFKAAKEKTIASLNLNEVDVSPQLGAFLQSPVDGLMRLLFDPLFGLLQGKIDLETFERTAVNLVEGSGKTFLHQGYLHWTALSLIHLMRPDGAYVVPVPDQTTEPDLTSADTRPGWYTEEVPTVIDAGRLALDFSLHTPFLVPRVILHSAIFDAFTSISSAFHEVYRQAKDLSKKLQWYSIQEIRREYGLGDLWPDMTLMFGDSGDDLRVSADYFSVARPDIILDVMDRPDWYESGGMERAKRHKSILKPKLGTFVVCLHPVPGAAIEEVNPLPQQVAAAEPSTEAATQQTSVAAKKPAGSTVEPCHDIHLLSVGFDAGALVPVIDAMRQVRAGDN